MSNVSELKAIIEKHAAGTKLDVATSQYADNTTPPGYRFDAYSSAAAVRSLVNQGLISAEYMWRYYEVTVLDSGESK